MGDANDWRNKMLANQNCQHEPVLGGPTHANLAQALDHYGRNFSVSKDGVDQELTRINHYLEGSSLPLLAAIKDDKGGVTVVEQDAKVLSPEFQAYVESRRASSAGTFAFKRKLGKMRCSQISKAHITAFHTQMVNDGLSDSSIQKEIALLKVFFNSVSKMNWTGLENPCLGIKLGKSKRRFVHLTAQQKEVLTRELLECDNPYFMPLVLTAKESTLRLDTLVNMTWSNTSIEERRAYLPTKTGDRPYTLSREVKTILEGLPQQPGGKIFPISKSAINSAWDRLRLKCDLPELQFRDLRHLGATDWVRRGLSAHELKQVLGHDGIATAQFYVDLVGKDLEDALDKASNNAGVTVLPLEFPKDPIDHLNQRRAQRLNKGRMKVAVEDGPSPSATDVSSTEQSATCEPSVMEMTSAQATPADALLAALREEPGVQSTQVSRNSKVLVFADFRKKAA